MNASSQPATLPANPYDCLWVSDACQQRHPDPRSLKCKRNEFLECGPCREAAAQERP